MTFVLDDEETERFSREASFSISSILPHLLNSRLIPLPTSCLVSMSARSFPWARFDFSTPSSVFVWPQSRQSEERFLRLIDHREQRSLRKQIFRATNHCSRYKSFSANVPLYSRPFSSSPRIKRYS